MSVSDDDLELPDGRTALDAATATREQLLNLAMAFDMQWGPTLGVTTERKLAVFVARLAADDAKALAAEAAAATSFGNRYIEDRSPGAGDHAEMAPYDELAAALLAAHPWVDEDNLGHCYSQSCYYTWHG